MMAGFTGTQNTLSYMHSTCFMAILLQITMAQSPCPLRLHCSYIAPWWILRMITPVAVASGMGKGNLKLVPTDRRRGLFSPSPTGVRITPALRSSETCVLRDAQNRHNSVARGMDRLALSNNGTVCTPASTMCTARPTCATRIPCTQAYN